jgi:hypothetical protein
VPSTQEDEPGSYNSSDYRSVKVRPGLFFQDLLLFSAPLFSPNIPHYFYLQVNEFQP